MARGSQPGYASLRTQAETIVAKSKSAGRRTRANRSTKIAIQLQAKDGLKGTGKLYSQSFLIFQHHNVNFVAKNTFKILTQKCLFAILVAKIYV